MNPTTTQAVAQYAELRHVSFDQALEILVSMGLQQIVRTSSADSRFPDLTA